MELLSGIYSDYLGGLTGYVKRLGGAFELPQHLAVPKMIRYKNPLHKSRQMKLLILKKNNKKKMRYKRKRYNRLAKRMNRKRFKRKNYRKKKFGITKKFKKFVGKIERVLGETKDTAYRTQTLPAHYVTGSGTVNAILDTIQWPNTGVGPAEMIGEEIFLKSIVMMMSFTNTSTNSDLNPIRVIVFKSWNKIASIVSNTLFEAGSQDSMWLTARFNPGFGKKLLDFVVQPKVVLENEYNVSTPQVFSVSKTLTINRNIRRDPKDNTMLTKAFIYVLCLRGVAPIGTGCVISMMTKWYYKDA